MDPREQTSVKFELKKTWVMFWYNAYENGICKIVSIVFMFQYANVFWLYLVDSDCHSQ